MTACSGCGIILLTCTYRTSEGHDWPCTGYSIAAIPGCIQRNDNCSLLFQEQPLPPDLVLQRGGMKVWGDFMVSLRSAGKSDIITKERT